MVSLNKTNPVVDKLLILAGGDLDLVDRAVKAASLRNFIHSGKDEAELLDIVNYIVAKRVIED